MKQEHLITSRVKFYIFITPSRNQRICWKSQSGLTYAGEFYIKSIINPDQYWILANMADNVKEANPTPPQPNADDNRRRTRSQTRNGGMTPPAPVVEPRGRKRGQSQPGSGGKRGRKPASVAAQPEEHSKQIENQDLSQKVESATEDLEHKQAVEEEMVGKDVEMKPAENEEEKIEKPAEDQDRKEQVQSQETPKIDEQTDNQEEATKDKHPKKEEKQEEKPKQDDRQKGKNDEEAPKQDIAPGTEDSTNEEQSKKEDEQPDQGEPEKVDNPPQKVEDKEPPKDEVEKKPAEAEVDTNNELKAKSEAKESDETPMQVTNNKAAPEKASDEQIANEEKKEGGDKETPATETAQAIST